jgi:hypothetical protein
MSSQLPGTKQNSKALSSEGFSAISMRTPRKALLGVELDLEHGRKTVNSVSCLAHVVHIVQQNSPIVNI